MIDVHLIGYTADLEHLVLDLDGESNGRYRLVVDADLIATLAEIRERCLEQDKHWPGDDLVEWDEEWDETEDWDDESEDETAEDDASDDDDADEAYADEADEVEAFEESDLEDAAEVEGEAEVEDAADTDEVDPEPEPAPAARRPTPRTAPAPAPPRSAPAAPTRATPDRPDPKLSPAEIQAMLRAGRTAQSVAKKAGTDVAWIERWLPPILEERARVLREARALKLKRPRLGTSRADLGDAVRRALADRNVDEDEVTWEASRRADGRWKVSVKYRHRNRARTASWTYDPREREIEPASDLAKELGFRGPKPKPKPKAAQAKPKAAQGKPKPEPASPNGSTAPRADAADSEPAPADAS